MRIGVPFITALVLLSVTPAMAALPYAKLASMQTAFEAIPAAQRDKLQLHQRVEYNNPAVKGPIHLWVVASNGRFDLPVAPDVTLGALNHPEWSAQKLLVQTDHPPGGLNLQIALTIVTPPASALTAAYLQSAIAQAQTATKIAARQTAGLLGTLLAPTITGVKLKPARCCNETASINGHTIKQAQTGFIALPLALLQTSPEAVIITSSPTVSVELLTK